MENLNTYEKNEVLFALGYLEELEKGIYIRENIDLKDKNVANKYNRYIQTIVKANPKEYFINEFKKIGIVDSQKLFVYIIYNIFNFDKSIEGEIKSFIQTLHFNNSNSIFNAVALSLYNKETKKLEQHTEIPCLDSVTSAICMAHEFIHYHMEKNNISTDKKRYYEEILSIYAEKIACEILDSLGMDKDLSLKVDSCRLESIHYHYKEKIDEMSSFKEMYWNAKKMMWVDAEYTKFVEMVDEQFPIFKNERVGMAYRLYSDALAQSYGIGYLYAENLFKFHLESNNTDTKIKQVLCGDMPLSELLNYFNISANNDDIYRTVSTKIKTISKFKK